MIKSGQMFGLEPAISFEFAMNDIWFTILDLQISSNRSWGSMLLLFVCKISVFYLINYIFFIFVGKKAKKKKKSLVNIMYV